MRKDLNLGTKIGMVSIDLSIADYFRFKLGGDIIVTFTRLGYPGRKKATLEIEQSTAGGHTVTYENVEGPNGLKPAISSTANKVDVVDVEVNYDCTKVYVTDRGKEYG